MSGGAQSRNNEKVTRTTYLVDHLLELTYQKFKTFGKLATPETKLPTPETKLPTPEIKLLTPETSCTLQIQTMKSKTGRYAK